MVLLLIEACGRNRQRCAVRQLDCQRASTTSSSPEALSQSQSMTIKEKEVFVTGVFCRGVFRGGKGGLLYALHPPGGVLWLHLITSGVAGAAASFQTHGCCCCCPGALRHAMQRNKATKSSYVVATRLLRRRHSSSVPTALAVVHGPRGFAAVCLGDLGTQWLRSVIARDQRSLVAAATDDWPTVCVRCLSL